MVPANNHTLEGELVDLVDEFSDGRIQFAFLKVKDSNSKLPKSVLIAWVSKGTNAGISPTYLNDYSVEKVFLSEQRDILAAISQLYLNSFTYVWVTAYQNGKS